MDRAYFPMYHSYLGKTASLSDAELGRLVRALLQYSIDGTRPLLNGRESGVFDFIAFDIDEAAKKYAALCDRNQKNINKRWEKEDTTVYERIPNDTKPYQTYDTQNTKHKTQSNKEKYNIPPKSPKGESDVSFGDDLTVAVNDWLSYKRERRESYKPTGHKLLLSQIANKAKEYGEAAVAEVIRTSISCGYKGIVFDRLKNMPIKATADDFDPDDPYAAWGDST